MNKRLCITIVVIAGLLLGTTTSSAEPGTTPLGTAFTYQGRLDRTGAPYTGSCDFLFSLFDAETEGTKIGETMPSPVCPFPMVSSSPGWILATVPSPAMHAGWR